MITEQQLLEFFMLIESFSTVISEECSAAAIPFICQYVYPPCDSSGTAQFITREKCINIRDDVCKTEWRIAMFTEQRNLLPVCETFDADNESSSVTSINDTKPLRCHYQFKEFCGVCLPLCDTFSQYSDQDEFAWTAVSITSAVLTLTSGSIFIIFVVIRPSQM